MKILIAPDKFKGSLTAEQVCEAVEKGILKVLPNSQIIKLPLADGGEGSLSGLESSLHFKKIYLQVANPIFKKIKTFYGLSNNTAYIEMANASGLQLLSKDERNPMLTTSLGTGEMIVDAIKRGVNKIYLFIGGSATNDAGIGIAAALGYRFLDNQKNILKPVGKNLIRIEHIDASKASSLINIEVNVLTDVNNILYGKKGAAYIFAKQKGAGKKEIKILDKGLENFAKVVKNKLEINTENIPGSGAAGGVGAGAIAFLNANIKSGIDTILDLLNIDNYILQSDFIITGEGLLDKQTLQGKVVKGVLDRCSKFNKKTAVICGDTTLTPKEIKTINASIISPIKTKEISKEESMRNAYSLLQERAKELMRKIS